MRPVPLAAALIAALLGLAPAAAGKGLGPHVLSAGPDAVYAATSDGRVHRVPAGEGAASSLRFDGFVPALQATADAVWVVSTPEAGGARLWRLDPLTLAPRLRAVRVPDAAMLAAGRRTVWVAGWSGKRLTGIDARTGRVTRRVAVPRGIAGIATAGDRLWVALYGRRLEDRRGRGPSTLLALDPDTGRPAEPSRSFRGRPWQLVADARGAWLRAGYRTLLGYDRGGGPPARVRFDSDVGALALDGRSVWVVTQQAGRVVRVGRDDGRGRPGARLAVYPSTLTAGAGAVWASDLLTPTVLRIDPVTGAIGARVPLPAVR